jgi:hypothetical protein
MSIRFRSAVVAIAAMGAVGFAGCANAPTESGSSNPSSATSPSTGSPSSPPSTSDGRHATVSAAQLKTSGAPKTAPTGIWLADGGRTLHISAGEAACSTLSARVLSQGKEVHIELHEQLKKTLVACPDHVTVKTVTAKLAAPLGKRTVVFTESQH